MVLLIDERPEEVTDFKRTVPAEIYASSNDEEVKSHLRIAELAIERAKGSLKEIKMLFYSLIQLPDYLVHTTQRLGKVAER